MTKAEAIRRIRAIQRGADVNRDRVLDVVDRGEIAAEQWDDPRFALGFEYGAIAGLAEAFGITKKDLEETTRTDSGRFYNLPGEDFEP
jgi:hypothetical protein